MVSGGKKLVLVPYVCDIFKVSQLTGYGTNRTHVFVPMSNVSESGHDP